MGKREAQPSTKLLQEQQSLQDDPQQEKENCPFCTPENFIRPHFTEYGVDPRLDKTPVVEMDNLVVTPDVLPASPDFHLIVYTREDCKVSFASSPELWSEMGEVLFQLEDLLNKPLFFVEHGGFSGNSKSGAGTSKVQTVSHRHAHLFPYELRLADYMHDALDEMKIENNRFTNGSYSPLLTMDKLPECRRNSYLFAQEVKEGGRGLVAYDRENIWPSQITQKNISDLLSGRELDWKLIEEDDELARTSVRRVLNIIEKCRY